MRAGYRSARALGWLVMLGGCAGGRAPTAATTPVAHAEGTAPTATTPAAEASAAPTEAGSPKSSLFPERKRGWPAVDDVTRAAIGELAAEYATFLGRAKTPRRAVASLVEHAVAHAARPLAPGQHFAHVENAAFYVVAPGGDAAAFVRLGPRPVEEGLRIVIASVDAPALHLEQRPLFDAAGFAMLDTTPYGRPILEAWLSRPLALYLHAVPAGAPALDIVVGEAPEDPVLVIPDLLPHLSGNVQRERIVDSPERLDAVAAHSRAALLDYLARRGVDEATLATAEATLVPAGPPTFIGVDRALLAGYGHRHRALAYAAVRGLFAAERLEQSAAVIVVSRAYASGDGSSGQGFVPSALSRILAGLGAEGEAQDVLATRRTYARSAALVASWLGGSLNQGVVLQPEADDALPAAVRRVLDSLEAAGAQWQLSGPERGHRTAAYELATLDLDVVAIGLPGAGDGAPLELLSTLDLYQGFLACRGWLGGS
jgi:aspartyl aminopeptidase